MLESKDGNGRGLETAQVYFLKENLYVDIKTCVHNAQLGTENSKHDLYVK